MKKKKIRGRLLIQDEFGWRKRDARAVRRSISFRKK